MCLLHTLPVLPFAAVMSRRDEDLCTRCKEDMCCCGLHNRDKAFKGRAQDCSEQASGDPANDMQP